MHIKHLLFLALLLISPLVAITQEPQQQKLLIICDMYETDIGGLENVVFEVRSRMQQEGIDVKLFGLADVPTFTVPFAGGLQSANPLNVRGYIKECINTYKPTYILIVLHGLMSQTAGFYCSDNTIPFTVFYPGRGPEVIKETSYIPCWITRPFINMFLRKANKVLVPSFSMEKELHENDGLTNVIAWPHGINADVFTLPTPQEKDIARSICKLENCQHPLYLYVGRISPEKNIPGFLNAKLTGTKIVVGPEYGGFNIEKLRKQYPEIIFTGPKRGQDLLNYYRAADIFFFPSKMDSFGLVMPEALSMGLPVVGFDTNGPRDVVPRGCGVSYLADTDQEIEEQAAIAWNDVQNGTVTAQQCHDYAQQFSWISAMEKFKENLFNTSF